MLLFTQCHTNWSKSIVQTPTLDEVLRKRDERNMQQRKHRADMSIEQREEINKKQRDYRQRKKAATQNSSTSVALTETVSLRKVLKCWPGMEYKIKDCNNVILLYKINLFCLALIFSMFVFRFYYHIIKVDCTLYS